MELHELEVSNLCPGAQRERHPIAGGHRRVRGRGINLAEPTGCQHDGTAECGTYAVSLTFTDDVQGDPTSPPGRVGEQVQDECVLDDLDVTCRVHGGNQGPLNLKACRIATGVRDAIAMVAALTGERQYTGILSVETRADGNQLTNARRSLRYQLPHCSLVTKPRTSSKCVGEMLLR
jgi:hypothetical protein